MADYGINRRYSRDRVILQVPRGFYPTEPGKLSFLAAPLDANQPNGTPIANRVAIKSGMAVTLTSSDAYHQGVAVDSGFRNTVAADAAAGGQFYIALTDADAHDVQQSGKLVGLDCSDAYEVLTPYFEAGTYTQGAAITVGAGGMFKLAAQNDFIVGYISEVGPNADGSHPYSGLTPNATYSDAIKFKTAQNGVKQP